MLLHNALNLQVRAPVICEVWFQNQRLILSMLFAKIYNIFFTQLLIEMLSFIVWTQSLLWHLEAITTPLKGVLCIMQTCCTTFFPCWFSHCAFVVISVFHLCIFLSLCLNVNPMHNLCPCTLKSLNDFLFVNLVFYIVIIVLCICLLITIMCIVPSPCSSL